MTVRCTSCANVAQWAPTALVAHCTRIAHAADAAVAPPPPPPRINREAGTWEPLASTTEILTATHVIEEQGVRLRLSLTDTPGFGDQVDNSDCFQPILQHITTQYSTYLQSEIGPNRPPKIPDTRIHALLYFISPTGHGLKPLDISFMKAVDKLVRFAQHCATVPHVSHEPDVVVLMVR